MLGAGTYSAFVELRMSAMIKRTEDEDIDLAALCKALGHPARIAIVRYLAEQGKCVFGDLSEQISLAPSTVSQHVTILKEAGLIVASAREQRMCYCINPDRMGLLKRLVKGL
jgi:ArsR family transcriptional regulator, arsenate/arsenite/antimonite-responsive transcriptional repressor